jgi:DNA adenine methylase
MQAVRTIEIQQQPMFPDTRYMGSKKALLHFIWDTLKQLNFQTVLDAFSGSSCVAQMFKLQGKQVTTNDHLEYAYYLASATVANSQERLSDDDIQLLLKPNRRRRQFIQRTFKGIYFSDDENKFLDNISANLRLIEPSHKRSIAIAALCRACVKRRPRGIFTFVGLDKYDDGRLDLRMHLREHFLRAVSEFNRAVYDNGQSCTAHNGDIFDLQIPTPDVAYFDPPYVTSHSDNDYLRRYHFVEGLCSYWERPGSEILHHTKTKKLKKYPTAFASKTTIYNAFDRLFEKFDGSTLVISYSSNCLPRKNELVAILKNHKRAVTVESLSHRYSFGTYNHKVGNPSNLVDEYLFIAQ